MPKIKHKRVDTNQNCGGVIISYIVLDGTPHEVRAKKGDLQIFERTDQDKQRGFKVVFDTAVYDKNGSNPSDTHQTLPGDVAGHKLSVQIPTGSLPGEIEYKIYYENEINRYVTPLDPVIIIEPHSFSKSLVSQAASFACGAAVALLSAWVVKLVFFSG